jgi:hypothetical protein
VFYSAYAVYRGGVEILATTGLVDGAKPRALPVAFVVLGVQWLTATTVAFARIRRQHVTQHREWMIRSYAHSLFIVTSSSPQLDGDRARGDARGDSAVAQIPRGSSVDDQPGGGVSVVFGLEHGARLGVVVGGPVETGPPTWHPALLAAWGEGHKGLRWRCVEREAAVPDMPTVAVTSSRGWGCHDLLRESTGRTSAIRIRTLAVRSF